MTFTQSTTAIPNPEKGFYHQIETAQQVANFSVLDVNYMTALKTGHTVNGTSFMPPVTLVLRLYYINYFINADFATTYFFD